MNPTTQVIKRFCCTLSSGLCSRCLHAARVFARAASLQLETQTLLLSMPYFAKASTLFTALKCRMQRCSWGETAAFWRGAFQHEAPQPTTRRLEIFTRGRVSQPRTALAGPGDCSRVHACQVMQTRTGLTLPLDFSYTGFLQHL